MTQAVQKKSPIDEVRDNLNRMAGQFRMALPPQITPEKFVRVVVTAIQTSSDLLTADRMSLYGACMKAAQDGLLPDGREAALIIFNKNVGTKQAPKWEKHAQYMPMIAGILKKVRNSGEIATITAHVVYEKDEFQYWIDDDGEHIKHRPAFEDDPGKPRGVYALAKTKDGAVYIERLTINQVEAIRNASKSKDKGPWVDWWDDMAKKSALRKLSKRLPMSTDAEGIVPPEADDYHALTVDETQTLPVERPASRVAAVIEAASEPVPAVDEERAAMQTEAL